MSEDCHCFEDKEKIKNEMTHWRKVLKFGLTLDIYIAIKRREHLKNKSDITIMIAFVGFYWDASYGYG